ncbi:MAG TPA: LacI family DNA-binding transcriptional regulator [Pseudolysinimonas sp.]|nr:LacI family DNA-binding transcriptional regulator [Pseudolysinimonas sp.]
MTARVTLKDVSRTASVSVGTASKVLNGRAGVAPETRSRVEAVLDRYGYTRRDIVDRPIVELTFGRLDEEWVIEVIRGVVAGASAVGSSVMLNEYDGTDTDWTDGVLRRAPSGVIVVAPRFSHVELTRLVSRGIPCVAIDPDGDPMPDVSSVGSANFPGGLAVGRHLMELGHRVVGVVGNDQRTSTVARIAGLAAAVQAGGGTLRTVAFGRSAPRDLTEEALSLLRPRDRPTAVFATSDVHALSVYEAARLLDLRIPAQLSVVGFDDLVFAKWAGPALTTVRQPLADMGREAARMLASTRDDRDQRRMRVELATSLVIRESTASPPDPPA